MPTLDELIRAKTKRLETVPGRFVSDITKVQLQLLQSIEDLLAEFDVDSSGNFVISEANLALAAELDVKLRAALDRSEYTEAITEFARQFNVQIGFNDAYFSSAFQGFSSSELGKMVVRSAQKTAVDLLLNISADAEFILPIKQQIENAVINGARFRETLDAIQLLTTGNDQQDGKILAYSKQISHDTFAVADRSYSAAVNEQVGAEWFRYSGHEIKSSRPFCVERKGKYFCKKEIELWGSGKNSDPSEFKWPQGGKWAGEMAGTDANTIFSTLGGYGCIDSIIAVSIFDVPKDQIQRAIDLGFFEPSKFEQEELGL